MLKSKNTVSTKPYVFCGVGGSKSRDRFLRVNIGDESIVLSLDGLAVNVEHEMKRLRQLGVPLLTSAAKSAFLRQAETEASKAPSFQVATQTGFLDGNFILPTGPVLKPSNVEWKFDAKFSQYHERIRPSGTPREWLRLAQLCKGNRHAIAGLVTALCSPVCAQTGREPPGIQFVGLGGIGKSLILRIGASVWGGDPNPINKLGCGVSWNSTDNSLEVVAAAYDQMVLCLDDMENATGDAVKAIMRMMQGQGRGRWTEQNRTMYCAALISTANKSIVRLLKEKGVTAYEAYIDRLADINLPKGRSYLFGNYHGAPDFQTFKNRILKLVTCHYGLAGPRFVRCLSWDLHRNRSKIEKFVDNKVTEFLAEAEGVRSRRHRDLLRVGERFGTLYATGCLAIKYKVLPFCEEELSAALLECLRDHVAFIDNELDLCGVPVKAVVSQEQPVERAIDRLKMFINKYRRMGFVDLTKGARAPAGRQARGYIAIYRGRKEYWLTNQQFERVAGSRAQADQLKRELQSYRLLSTDKGRLVVKRPVPGFVRRPYVVAIKHKP